VNPIDQLLDLLNAYPADGFARRESMPKPDGSIRYLAKPNKTLGSWLRQANSVLNACYTSWPSFVHGGRKKHSYVSYARPHVGKQCVVTIDIKKCFDSITELQVAAALEKHLHLTAKDAKRLAHRVCFRGILAQGFSTSNFICNLVLLDALKVINDYLQPERIDFTNYVDDLALSGDITSPDVVINEVTLALSRTGLSVKKAKMHVMPANRQQIICGLIVNKRLTVSKKKKQELLTGAKSGTISKASIGGWVANLKNVDPAFSYKLRDYAAAKVLPSIHS
jgi:hypothetical protein